MSRSSEGLEPARQRSYRTKRFKDLFDGLPQHVQASAVEVFKRFQANPYDPVLKRVALDQAKPYEEVYVTYRYRALFRQGDRATDDHVFIWTWIGSREDTQGAARKLSKSYRRPS